MSAPVDLATVVFLDCATASATILIVSCIEAFGGHRAPTPPPQPPLPPPAEPPTEPGPPFVTAFGDSLPELRAALANFDLVHEIANADGHEPGIQELRAFAYAEWSLYHAAGRLRRAYNAKLDEVAVGGVT